MEGLTKKRELSTVTAEIRMLTEQAGALALDYAVEIGRRLTEARELVERGGWEDYLGEIGYKKSTANNFMRVYREYGDPQGSLFGASCKSEVLGKLTYSKALELLALPEGERETFAAEVGAEHISTRELKDAIRERDEARAQLEKAKKAEQLLEETKRRAQEAGERAAALEAQSARMEKELEELRSRPVEVAVQKDEAAEQEAFERGKAEEAQKLGKALQLKEEQLRKVRAEAEKAKEAALAAHKERDRLCAELETAKKGAGSTAETEELRKQLAMAAPELQEFRVLFTTWQETFNRMQGIAEKLRAAGREENAGKLHTAMTAALEQMQKGMRDGD